jgi:hypothetical protein
MISNTLPPPQPFPSFEGCEVCRTQLGAKDNRGDPTGGDPQGVLFTCAHHTPTDPTQAATSQNPTSQQQPQPPQPCNPMARTPQLAPPPTTHHRPQMTATTTTTACPRTQDTAHLPQQPQTCCVNQCSSTHNNDSHPQWQGHHDQPHCKATSQNGHMNEVSWTRSSRGNPKLLLIVQCSLSLYSPSRGSPKRIL